MKGYRMKIFTGNDRAQEMSFTDRLGKITFKTHREMQAYLMRLHYDVTLPGEYAEMPIEMRIDFGRMIAQCECGGVVYVQPDDPYFYCSVCRNEGAGGLLRRVIFPDNLQEICEELLKRENQVIAALPPTQAARDAKGLPRSWNPGQTIEDLEAERLMYIKDVQ